jgi:hypothetical protein
MDHGIYGLFAHFFWLIFPIFGMAMGVMAMRQRHVRANRTIDLIKSYADRGKEPPPELLAALRDPDFTGKGTGSSLWVPICLFAALSAGFVMFALMTANGDMRHMVPFLFVALIMGGLCVRLVVTKLTRPRDGDRPR